MKAMLFSSLSAMQGRCLRRPSEAQEALGDGPMRVRMGLHTGNPLLDPPKYVGMDVHLAARIMSAGHGGQMLLSNARGICRHVQLRDLGEHRLKDFDEPVWIFQLGEKSFPPLKTISNTNLPRPAFEFRRPGAGGRRGGGAVREGARLVTLTGPGGIGKTRLAIEAAAELVAEFKAGVFWVGLASLRDPALWCSIRRADARCTWRSGRAHRRARDVAAARQPGASRLGGAGAGGLIEHARICGWWSPPGSCCGSAARSSTRCCRSPSRRPSTCFASRPGRAERCGRASSAGGWTTCRLRSSSPRRGRSRSRRANPRPAAQRLDLFKGGRDADPRQKTLRATIEWSYDLLTGRRAIAVRAASASSPGGCTLDAAEKSATPTWIRCNRWSRRAWSVIPATASGCSRRSATSHSNGWNAQQRRAQSTRRTRSTTSLWWKTSNRSFAGAIDRQQRSSGSRQSSTTCALLSGSGSTVTMICSCGSWPASDTSSLFKATTSKPAAGQRSPPRRLPEPRLNERGSCGLQAAPRSTSATSLAPANSSPRRSRQPAKEAIANLSRRHYAVSATSPLQKAIRNVLVPSMRKLGPSARQ